MAGDFNERIRPTHKNAGLHGGGGGGVVASSSSSCIFYGRALISVLLVEPPPPWPPPPWRWRVCISQRRDDRAGDCLRVSRRHG